MSRIEWVIGKTQKQLQLGRECLVKLQSQNATEFIAHILGEQYRINNTLCPNAIFTVSKNDELIATVSQDSDKQKGVIVFQDAISFYYSFSFQNGLNIYYELLTNDSIRYQRKCVHESTPLNISIGIEIADFDIDRLLLLLTIGELLFRFLETELQANYAQNPSSFNGMGAFV